MFQSVLTHRVGFVDTVCIHKDTTPTMTFITNNIDTPLTNGVIQLAAYSALPVVSAK